MDEFRTIPGAAYALGFKGLKAYLEANDEMLAREYRKYKLVGSLDGYAGYFKDHPDHIVKYEQFLINPPDSTVHGPIAEKLIKIRTELDAAIAAADASGY